MRKGAADRSGCENVRPCERQKRFSQSGCSCVIRSFALEEIAPSAIGTCMDPSSATDCGHRVPREVPSADGAAASLAS